MKIWVLFYFDRAIARTANEPPGSRAVVHCSSPKSFDPQTPLTYNTHPSKGNSASAFPAPSHHPPKGNSASAFPAPSHHPPKRTAPAPSRPSNSSSYIMYFFVQYIDIFVHLPYNTYIIKRGDYYGKINNK